MQRRPMLIAGNWKMNGTRAQAAAFIEKLAAYGRLEKAGRQLLICPPATLIDAMADDLAKHSVSIGGQDCHSASHGAFTGDISAAMLADMGCTHVIVGHSERRAAHGETSSLVRAKAEAALSSGLTPIICVGESWDERKSGKADLIVAGQIEESVPANIDLTALVIAYEPLWAIGSGRAATVEDIRAMHQVIHEALARKIPGGVVGTVLYGGSVKPDNAAEILGLDLVDGALIGGASLAAHDFMAIADCVPI